MTKAEYIARYGEEAYEKRKRQMREYKQANKEYFKEYMKEYRQANREQILEEHKEYYQANKERILEQMKEWYQANREKKIEQQKEYNSTLIGRATTIVKSNNHADRARGFDISNNVDRLWVLENIFTSKCIYCGDSVWTHLGCDRIDNTKPHTPDNVVCCCGECNVVRNNRFTVDEFKSYRATNPKTTPVRI